MNVFVIPTGAVPTVALEPPTISTTPCPFTLTCCVAVLLDKNPSSVTVPDCAQARPGSTASVIIRTFGKIKRDKNLRIKPPPGPCERARRRLYAQVFVALDLSEGSDDYARCAAGPSLTRIVGSVAGEPPGYVSPLLY